MGNLENILKGIGNGLATALDPIGSGLSSTDYSLTGIGPADKNSLPTLYSHCVKEIYQKPSQKLETKTYAQRFIGSTLGVTAGIGLYLLAPVTTIIPIATGIYSTIASGIKYIQNFVNGENSNPKKATFKDGFKLGYEQATSFLGYAHDIESYTTGRGLRDSQIQDPITQAAQKTKRNFTSITGNLFGKSVGLIVSGISFFLVPLYKTFKHGPKAIGALA